MSQSTLITRILDLIAEIEKGNKYQWDNDKRIIQAETLISLLDSKGYQAIVTARLDALAEISYDNARAKSRYNGWSNYETWCVNLWIDSYDEDEIAAMDDVAAIARYIEELVDETNPIAEGSDLFTDILNANLREVNYSEIAQHWYDDTNDARKTRNGVSDISVELAYDFPEIKATGEDVQTYINLVTERIEETYPDAMVNVKIGKGKERIWINNESTHEERDAIVDILSDVFHDEEWIAEPNSD